MFRARARRALIVIGAALAIAGYVGGGTAQTRAAAAPAHPGNWPAFRRTATHTGWNRTETVLGPSTVAGLRRAWSATTGNEIPSSPAFVNGVVYVGSHDHKLYAFKLAGR